MRYYLKEETGLEAETVESLGSYFPDTERLANEQFAFFGKASYPDQHFQLESGMSVDFVTYEKLKDMIKTKEFSHLLHIAVITLYELNMKNNK